MSYTTASMLVIDRYGFHGRADAAIVFFEGFGPHHDLSEETFARVNHAHRLLRQQRVGHIVCLGGGKPKRSARGAELMCEVLHRKGVPAGALHADRMSWDTDTNWGEATRIASANGWRSVALVSSPLHMLRIFGVTVGSDLEIYLSPAPWPEKWSIGAGLSTWRAIHHEIVAWMARVLLPREAYRSLIEGYRGLGLQLI